MTNQINQLTPICLYKLWLNNYQSSLYFSSLSLLLGRHMTFHNVWVLFFKSTTQYIFHLLTPHLYLAWAQLPFMHRDRTKKPIKLVTGGTSQSYRKLLFTSVNKARSRVAVSSRTVSAQHVVHSYFFEKSSFLYTKKLKILNPLRRFREADWSSINYNSLRKSRYLTKKRLFRRHSKRLSIIYYILKSRYSYRFTNSSPYFQKYGCNFMKKFKIRLPKRSLLLHRTANRSIERLYVGLKLRRSDWRWAARTDLYYRISYELAAKFRLFSKKTRPSNLVKSNLPTAVSTYSVLNNKYSLTPFLHTTFYSKRRSSLKLSTRSTSLGCHNSLGFFTRTTFKPSFHYDKWTSSFSTLISTSRYVRNLKLLKKPHYTLNQNSPDGTATYDLGVDSTVEVHLRPTTSFYFPKTLTLFDKIYRSYFKRPSYISLSELPRMPKRRRRKRREKLLGIERRSFWKKTPSSPYKSPFLNLFSRYLLLKRDAKNFPIKKSHIKKSHIKKHTKKSHISKRSKPILLTRRTKTLQGFFRRLERRMRKSLLGTRRVLSHKVESSFKRLYFLSNFLFRAGRYPTRSFDRQRRVPYTLLRLRFLKHLTKYKTMQKSKKTSLRSIPQQGRITKIFSDVRIPGRANFKWPLPSTNLSIRLRRRSRKKLKFSPRRVARRLQTLPMVTRLSIRNSFNQSMWWLHSNHFKISHTRALFFNTWRILKRTPKSRLNPVIKNFKRSVRRYFTDRFMDHRYHKRWGDKDPVRRPRARYMKAVPRVKPLSHRPLRGAKLLMHLGYRRSSPLTWYHLSSTMQSCFFLSIRYLRFLDRSYYFTTSLINGFLTPSSKHKRVLAPRFNSFEFQPKSSSFFTLPSNGFLLMFNSQLTYKLASSQFAKLIKNRFSFSYILDVKRFIIRRFVKTATLNTFTPRLLPLFDIRRSEVNYSDTFTTSSKTLASSFLPTMLSQGTNSTTRAVYTSAKFYTNDDDVDLRIKRIRFKPGYSKIWRSARSSLKAILGLSYRYQSKLTSYIFRFYRIRRQSATYYTNLTLAYILGRTHFVNDVVTVKHLLSRDVVYVNGSSVHNPNILLFTNDFIQLIVHIKYYITYKWTVAWALKKRSRILKLRSTKFKKSGAGQGGKQVSFSLPNWVLNYRTLNFDIPKYLEVDYLTLSVFVLYEPLMSSDVDDSPLVNDKNFILNMYNWKYIT